MFRSLLVIEDYNELVFLGGVLRKIGFDLEAVQTTAKYTEFMLSLNPQVLIISSSGKKVDLSLIQKDLKKRAKKPKIVLLVNPTQNLEDLPMLDIDVILSSPVKVDKLIDAIADQLGIDPAPYLTKFNRLNMSGVNSGSDDTNESLSNEPLALDEFRESLQIIKGSKADKQHDQSISRLNQTDLIEGSDIESLTGESSFADSLLSQPIKGGLLDESVIENIELKKKSSTESKISAEPTLKKSAQDPEQLYTTAPLPEIKISPSQLSSQERNDRFAKLLSNLTVPKEARFSRELVAANNKALREQEKITSLYDLEKERKNFVKKLFKPKK